MTAHWAAAIAVLATVAALTLFPSVWKTSLEAHRWLYCCGFLKKLVFRCQNTTNTLFLGHLSQQHFFFTVVSFNLCLKLCVCLPLGAFGKLHRNSLAVDRQSGLESLQDLEQLRRLLLTKHRDLGSVWVQLLSINMWIFRTDPNTRAKNTSFS